MNEKQQIRDTTKCFNEGFVKESFEREVIPFLHEIGYYNE